MPPFEIHISPAWCREIRTLTRKPTTGFVMKTQSSLITTLVSKPLWPVVRFYRFHKWTCWWCWFEIATFLLTLWSLSLVSQKAPRWSQRSPRWSKTAYIQSLTVILWMTNAISDWDGDESFSAKSWRCNIWYESLVKLPIDSFSPDEQIWFLTNKSSSDEQVEFPTNGNLPCRPKAEFPTKRNFIDAFAGTNPT